MANDYPCNAQPVKFVNCCDVMDCMNIKSSDNSLTVSTSNCGVDITLTGNNLDQKLNIQAGTCISFTKNFVNGVLTITPVIDWDCVAAQICGKCPPPTIPPAPVVCPQPLGLSVSNV